MDATSLLRSVIKGFKPPERITVSEWSTQNYELPETSAEPGRWNPSRAPYQPGIMDAINEPGIQKVSIMCCAQVGKTIILLAIICYLIDLDPCSMLMTFPSAEAAEIFSKEKLSSAIVHIKALSEKIVLKSRNATSTILLTSSHRGTRGIPKHHYFGFCFFPLLVFRNCPLELCLSGLMFAPQTVTASPAAKILRLALMSRS